MSQLDDLLDQLEDDGSVIFEYANEAPADRPDDAITQPFAIVFYADGLDGGTALVIIGRVAADNSEMNVTVHAFRDGERVAAPFFDLGETINVSHALVAP